MRWFGDPWPSAELRAPVCEDDRLRIETPVGEACLLCKEPIVEGDRGTTMGEIVQLDDGTPVTAQRFVHIECSLRSVTGNHIHVAGQCRHTGDCNDRSTLTYRQEALEVWQMRAGEATG